MAIKSALDPKYGGFVSRKTSVYNKLFLELKPTHLEVTDFSHQHSVPDGSESHLTVTIAAERFRGLRLVQRHRLVYQTLQEEMTSGLHALQIHAFTEDELEQAEIQPPPRCKGGA